MNKLYLEEICTKRLKVMSGDTDYFCKAVGAQGFSTIRNGKDPEHTDKSFLGLICIYRNYQKHLSQKTVAFIRFTSL